MAIECEPSDLIEASKCFTCLDAKQIAMVKVYLLQQILEDTQTTDQLVAAAKCFSCLSEQQLKWIENYLLCQLVNAM